MLLRTYMSPSRYATAHLLNDAFVGLQQSLAAKTTAPMVMRLDVREDEKAYHVAAELPGLGESEVELTFDDGVLTIRGEKKIVRDDKTDKWHMTERRHGSFERQLTMPDNVDASAIAAKFDKGVLNVTLPKSAPAQTTSRKIEIKAG